MYENERESIEAQYREAKEQVVQRLLGAMEDRRRKLREEKEGGEVISGTFNHYHRNENRDMAIGTRDACLVLCLWLCLAHPRTTSKRADVARTIT